MSQERPAARLRVAIVDDEELARRVLREYLAAHPDVEIVAECANGFEAVQAVSEREPDLLLLDVQMPKLDGFEVLELLERDVPVIFVTAYDEYAVRAFEVHAVDYLLKPFAPGRLAEALARARTRIAAGPRRPLPLAEIRAAAGAAPRPLERILIRDGARDDYVCLRSGGKEFLKHQTLTELEGQLDAARFVRIHRGYLLNLDRLAKIELYAKDSRVAVLADGTQLPLSRAGYARLRELS
jgi:two-component system LytT family response regulator